MAGCWEATQDKLAAFCHSICGSRAPIVKEDVKPRGDGRTRNRHQSIIRLDNKANSVKVSGDALSDEKNRKFQSVVSLAYSAFRRPKVEVQKSLLAAVDPKAVNREAVVLVMVGLPARGKSYISGAVLRHLQLLGVRVRTFNAGELRRDTGKAGIQANFFSADNKAAKSERDALAMQCCDNLLEWLSNAPKATSSVGILDATNTTRPRRRAVLERCHEAAINASASGRDLAPLRVIFLESVCNDESLLQGNYRMKLQNDDYKGSNDPEAALNDFRSRVKAYEQQYEPLEDDELTFGADGILPVGCVRIYDGGHKIVCCETNHSIVAAPFISLLHAMHLTPRRVLLAPEAAGGGGFHDAQVISAFLKKAEEEEGKHIDVICGASKHSTNLAQQLELMAPCSAARLSEPMESPTPMESPAQRVHFAEDVRSSNPSTSTTPSGRQTSGKPNPPSRPCRTILTLRALEPRSSGCHGHVDQEANRESYADLVRRMRSEVLLLIERLPRSVLVVCPGEDVRRVLLAHFNGCNVESIADMPLPERRVVELTRDHKGFSCREVDLPKPKKDVATSQRGKAENGKR